MTKFWFGFHPFSSPPPVPFTSVPSSFLPATVSLARMLCAVQTPWGSDYWIFKCELCGIHGGVSAAESGLKIKFMAGRRYKWGQIIINVAVAVLLISGLVKRAEHRLIFVYRLNGNLSICRSCSSSSRRWKTLRRKQHPNSKQNYRARLPGDALASCVRVTVERRQGKFRKQETTKNTSSSVHLFHFPSAAVFHLIYDAELCH